LYLGYHIIRTGIDL